MKKLKLFSLLGVVAAIGLYSCSKGPSGATGPQGPAGPDSVYHSAWINADFIGGLDQYGDSEYVMAVQAPNITQGILDSGLVISYISSLDANGIFSDVEPLNGLPVYEDYTPGIIYYTTYPTNENAYGTTLNGVAALRFVVIPSAVLASTSSFSGLSKAQIRTMSYSKITSILGNSGTVIKNN